jgi:hypothetical protein
LNLRGFTKEGEGKEAAAAEDVEGGDVADVEGGG